MNVRMCVSVCALCCYTFDGFMWCSHRVYRRRSFYFCAYSKYHTKRMKKITPSGNSGRNGFCEEEQRAQTHTSTHTHTDTRERPTNDTNTHPLYVDTRVIQPESMVTTATVDDDALPYTQLRARGRARKRVSVEKS